MVIVCGENLSLQYLNSINCILMLLLKPIGGLDWYGSLLTHKRFGLDLILQWHLWFWYVHGSSHGRTVFSSGYC